MAYDGENLYLSIPEPDEPEDEDRYLFSPLWLVGKMKQEDQHESL